jgi:transcriptional regulator EpsA
MFKVPSEDDPGVAQDWGHFSSLVNKILDAKSHADLGALVRDGLQHHIQHDVLIAAWGNFRLGVIHYDLLATDPELHAEGVEAGSMAPSLAMLFQQWMVMGRKPMRVSAGVLAGFWERSGLTESVIAAMKAMGSVVLHGIQDQRGSNDCLYAFFNRASSVNADDDYVLRILVPYLDVAFRQVELPPPRVTQSEPAQPSSEFSDLESDQSTHLSERESEIMRWVSLGKTNQEIGSILNLSSFTVKNHMQRIFKKLDVFNRAQAVSAYRARDVAQS